MPTKNEIYKNEYNREKYDRIGLMLPKGEKERLQTVAKDCGKSLNALIYESILNMYPQSNLHNTSFFVQFFEILSNPLFIRVYKGFPFSVFYTPFLNCVIFFYISL